MVRTLGTMRGVVVIMLCLLSSVALAQSPSSSGRAITPSQLEQQPPAKTQGEVPIQPQSRDMTCMTDDGKGNCIGAAEANGPTVVVIGEGMKKGDKMHCQDFGNGITCQPATSPVTK
jgi:hypothetical protein